MPTSAAQSTYTMIQSDQGKSSMTVETNAVTRIRTRLQRPQLPGEPV